MTIRAGTNHVNLRQQYRGGLVLVNVIGLLENEVLDMIEGQVMQTYMRHIGGI